VIFDLCEKISKILDQKRPISYHYFAKAHSILEFGYQRLITLLNFLYLYTELLLCRCETLYFLLKPLQLSILKLRFSIAQLLFNSLYLSDIGVLKVVVIAYHLRLFQG
jgi:hypothetical protein